MKKEHILLFPLLTGVELNAVRSTLNSYVDYISTECNINRNNIQIELDCNVPELRFYCGKSKWKKVKFLMDVSTELLSWHS